MRRIIFDTDLGDERWLNSLAKAGFTQEDISHIYEFVETSFFDNVDSGPSDSPGNKLIYFYPPVVHQYLDQPINDPQCMCTTTGSAAGTPFANLLYSLAMPRVLKTMRRSLLQEELVTSLKVPDTGNAIPLHDVSFVDDMALPIVCPANILTSRIADVCGIVYLVFKMYGMELLFLCTVCSCVEVPGTWEKESFE